MWHDVPGDGYLGSGLEVPGKDAWISVRGWSKRAGAWLRKCPAWQFVLVWDAAMVAGVLIGVSLSQWLWRHHLSALLGSAVGTAIGSAILAIAYKQSHKDATKTRL